MIYTIEVHAYNINIQLKYLPVKYLINNSKHLSFNNLEDKSESNYYSNIDISVFFISFKITNIDSYLIKSNPIINIKFLLYQLKRLKVFI